MHRGIPWVATLTLVAATGLALGAAHGAVAAPMPVTPASTPEPMFMEFPACTSDRQLDCVESIDLMERNGDIVKGSVSARGDRVPIERAEPGSTQWGFVNGTGYYQTDTWRLPGLRQEYGTEFIRPLIQLVTPGLKVNSQGRVSKWPSGLKVELIPGTAADSQNDDDMRVACPPSTTPCAKIPSFSPDQRLRVAVRTSWLRPAYANTTLRDFKVAVTPLPGGGSRIVASGVPLPMPGFFDFIDVDVNGQPREQFDYVQHTWLVDFIDAWDPDFPKDCLGEVFPYVSSNAWRQSEPYWDPDTDQLTFMVSAPHRGPDGRVFRGYYDALLPGDMAKCLWGENPRRLASLLEIEITEDDGETQVATTSAGFTRGNVRVNARNFHFSSPTITLKKKKRGR